MGDSEVKTMNVPLEEWVRQIISETVRTHSGGCPIKTIVEGDEKDKSNSLVVRVDRIERAMLLAVWVITPVYLAGAGFIITAIIQHFGTK